MIASYFYLLILSHNSIYLFNLIFNFIFNKIISIYIQKYQFIYLKIIEISKVIYFLCNYFRYLRKFLFKYNKSHSNAQLLEKVIIRNHQSRQKSTKKKNNRRKHKKEEARRSINAFNIHKKVLVFLNFLKNCINSYSCYLRCIVNL